MNSIENYKKRFNMLMESSLGDVRPLIMETYTDPTTKAVLKVKDEKTLNQLISSTSQTVSFQNVTSEKYLNAALANLIWYATALWGNSYAFTLSTTPEQTSKFINNAINVGKTSIDLIKAKPSIGNEGLNSLNALTSPDFLTYLNQKSSKNIIPGTQPPKYYTDWQVFLNAYILPYVAQKGALIEKTPTLPKQ